MLYDPLSSLLSDRDAWLGVLISEPRAALRAARDLRGSSRFLDGPFPIGDGKAGSVPVTICVTDPGGPGAWFAGAKLLARRVRPTLLVGFTRAVWCGDEMDRPECLTAIETLDLAPLTLCLRRIEPTATGAPPAEALDLARGIVPARHGSPLPPNLSEHLSEGEKRVEVNSPARDTFNGSLARMGRLGCWSGGTVQSPSGARWLREHFGLDGIDRESAGLGDAAAELAIPWMVFASCAPPDDPAPRDNRKIENGKPIRRGGEVLSLGAALSRFLETVARTSP